MAATVSGASLSGILDRVSAVSPHNPMTAETFADWSTEAGDIVTLKQGEDEYAVPLHSTRMVWRGAPEMTMDSAGQQKREPLAAASRRKYGRGSSAMRGEMEIYREFTSSDGYLHSFVYMTESELRTHFDNSLSDVHSEIIQTASQIRSEVHAANSTIYSYVDQTATYIIQHVGERTGNRVITQLSMPVNDPENPFVDGDIWIQTTLIRTWDDADLAWNSDTNYDWTQVSGSKVYVWKNGAWKLTTDETVLAESADLYHTKESVGLYAQKLYSVDGVMKANFARLDVRNDQIKAEVVDAVNGLGSTITQTATQIRSEVHAANSTLYSYIEQTATYIRSEVANVESGLQSSIQQEANKIALVVEGTGNNAHIKPASIVAAINDGESSVVISATHIDLNGYVKASDLTTDWLSAKIAGITSLGVQNMAASGSISIKENNIYYGIKRSINELQISLSGNTYTLQYKKWDDTNWQSAGTFSRATTLSGAWSSGKITVNASPQGSSWYSELKSVANADLSWSGTTVSFPVYAYNNGSETAVSTGKTMSVNVSGKLQSKTFTTTGTKTPDDGYIGFSQVVISLPTYTSYTFHVSNRTQDSSGYHYTMTIGTGWNTPFPSSGNTTLYKRN